MKKRLTDAAKLCFRDRLCWAGYDVLGDEDFCSIHDKLFSYSNTSDPDEDSWFLLLCAEAME